MKSVVVGTAGHIDHGKSALVEALTGTHPDRLEEEKRRGITIDLGFAFLDLPDLRLAFIDVPGHERFVRNMLAGATGIDLVLLVVASDESIKPQTREHFEICRLLGIQRGLVALSKADLVDAETLELVRLEVEEFLRGSFLEGAPIIPTSARTGQGIVTLKNALREIGLAVPPRDSSHLVRLPIDRAFAVKGFGTVVTGTLLSGRVHVGDELEIFPPRLRVRVRGLQSAGQPASELPAGQRVALNLAGIEREQLRRGMTLASPGCLRTSTLVVAQIHLLGSARPLRPRTLVHFHHGTADTVAEVLLLEGQRVEPGETALVQLRLHAPLLILPGDRFILRQFSPVTTIGGGLVLDLPPRPVRGHDLHLVHRLRDFERSAPEDYLAYLLETTPAGLTLAEAVARTGWTPAELERLAGVLAQRGRARVVGHDPWVLAPVEVLETCRENLLRALAAFHQAQPLQFGMHKEELRKQVAARLHPSLFHAALIEARQRGQVNIAGDQVSLAGRQVTLTAEEEQARQQLESLLERAGFQVPRLSDLLPQLRLPTDRAMHLVQLLLRAGSLVRVSEELVYHHSTIARLRALLEDYKQRQGERISVPAFKDLTGVTRKHAIPLLEYLDRQKVTRRVGDDRVIL